MLTARVWIRQAAVLPAVVCRWFFFSPLSTFESSFKAVAFQAGAEGLLQRAEELCLDGENRSFLNLDPKQRG